MTLESDLARAGFGIDGSRIVNPEGCEINVAHTCNLACRGCTHLSPCSARSMADPGQVHDDLAALATVYRCDFVKLLGGEPLLHRDVASIADAARSTGIAERIVLCSNGVLLDRADDRVWASIDEMEVSVYPGHEPDSNTLAVATARARDHGVRFHLNRTSHFRESYSEFGTRDANLARDVFATCKMAHVWRCHTVHDGSFYRCPPSVFIPLVVDGAEGRLPDGIPLSPTDDLFERLGSHLTATDPLDACSRCLGSVGRRFEHVQLARVEWRSHQEVPSEALVDREFLDALLADPNASDGCVHRRDVIVEGH